LNAADLLQDLVRCPSVTPAEGGALAVLEHVLKPAGFLVDRPVFSDNGTPDVENLFATIGDGGPHLVFAGHTDVVPTGPEGQWTHPPFAGEIADGVLYGRGSADMKGGIACFVAAALGWLKGGDRPGRISFLITGDEEGPAINGTVKLLEWAAAHGHRFDACLVGEPTNAERVGETIKVGRRGSVSGTITVAGKQGHVAHQHLADNPVPRLITLAKALADARFDNGNGRFPPTNLEVTSVDVGNTVFNVIPAGATARFNIRFTDDWTYETITERIRAVLDSAGGRGTYAIDFERFNSPAFHTDAGALIDPLAAAIEAETGRKPERSTGGGTSDARFIKAYCPVVEFGLVHATIHQIDERVPVSDLELLTRIYRRFIENYFAGAR
jgi:succinyl-diaminopimelate desuccinylase